MISNADYIKSPIVACPACASTGYIGSDYCAICHGDGFTREARIASATAAHSAPKHACHAAYCRPLRRSIGLK